MKKKKKSKRENIYLYLAVAVIVLIVSAALVYSYLTLKKTKGEEIKIDEFLFREMKNSVILINDKKCLFCVLDNTALELIKPKGNIKTLDISNPAGRLAIREFEIEATSALIVDREALFPEGQIVLDKLIEDKLGKQVSFKEKTFYVVEESGLGEKAVNLRYLRKNPNKKVMLFCDPFQISKDLKASCAGIPDKNISYDLFVSLPVTETGREAEKYILCSNNKKKVFEAISQHIQENDFNTATKVSIVYDLKTKKQKISWKIVDENLFREKLENIVEEVGENPQNINSCIDNNYEKLREVEREKAKQYFVYKIPAFVIHNNYLYYGVEDYLRKTCYIFGNCKEVLGI